MAQQLRGSHAHRKLTDLNAWHKQYQEPVLEPDLPIVDAHHHLWDDGRRGRYLIDELASDIDNGHKIIATVFVEAGLKYRAAEPFSLQPVGEVEFVAAITGNNLNRRETPQLCAAIVGHADLMLGASVRPVLEALIAAGNGRLRGIRHNVAWDDNSPRADRKPHQLLDANFREGFGCLQACGLSFDAWLFHPQLPELMDLLLAFPDTSVILNHVGGLLVPQGEHAETYADWRRYVVELARYPNLTVKIGGLGMQYCGWDFHLRDVPPSSEELAAAWRPYIETCIEAFGASRCMMESNFPVDKQSCSYGVLWNAFKRVTHGCSATEKAALYRDTAARIYRLAPALPAD